MAAAASSPLRRSAAAARGLRRPPGATATSSLSTLPRRPLSPKAPKSRKGPLGGVFRSPGRAEKRKVVPPLLPDPRPLSLSLLPLHLLTRTFLSPLPHPPGTRKHRPAPVREARVQARPAAPPLPVQAGRSSGLKRVHKAAAPREGRRCSAPLLPDPPKAEKLMWPPKDASEKSACGSSRWPWIQRLSPRPSRSEDKCFSLWKFFSPVST